MKEGNEGKINKERGKGVKKVGVWRRKWGNGSRRWGCGGGSTERESRRHWLARQSSAAPLSQAKLRLGGNGGMLGRCESGGGGVGA